MNELCCQRTLQTHLPCTRGQRYGRCSGTIESPVRLHIAMGLVVGVLAATVAFAQGQDGAVSPRPSTEQLQLQTSAAPKVERYVAKLIKRYDVDDNGSLNAEEWQAMHGQPAEIDGDTDGRISYGELLQHVVGYAAHKRLGPPPPPRRGSPEARSPQPASAGIAPPQQPVAAKPFHVPAHLLPASLPDWFRACDRNGDGQVSLAEYSPRVEAAEIAEFNRLDGNRDGLITAAELAPVDDDQREVDQQTDAR